jgi:hypothetical protein
MNSVSNTKCESVDPNLQFIPHYVVHAICPDKNVDCSYFEKYVNEKIRERLSHTIEHLLCQCQPVDKSDDVSKIQASIVRNICKQCKRFIVIESLPTCQVQVIHSFAISSQILDAHDMLFINLLHDDHPDFTSNEISAVNHWVHRNGGSLFSIVDHTNAYGHADRMNRLLQSFHIQVLKTSALDFPPHVVEGNAWIKITNHDNSHAINQDVHSISFQNGATICTTADHSDTIDSTDAHENVSPNNRKIPSNSKSTNNSIAFDSLDFDLQTQSNIIHTKDTGAFVTSRLSALGFGDYWNSSKPPGYFGDYKHTGDDSLEPRGELPVVAVFQGPWIRCLDDCPDQTASGVGNDLNEGKNVDEKYEKRDIFDKKKDTHDGIMVSSNQNDHNSNFTWKRGRVCVVADQNIYGDVWLHFHDNFKHFANIVHWLGQGKSKDEFMFNQQYIASKQKRHLTLDSNNNINNHTDVNNYSNSIMDSLFAPINDMSFCDMLHVSVDSVCNELRPGKKEDEGFYYFWVNCNRDAQVTGTSLSFYF